MIFVRNLILIIFTINVGEQPFPDSCDTSLDQGDVGENHTRATTSLVPDLKILAIMKKIISAGYLTDSLQKRQSHDPSHPKNQAMTYSGKYSLSSFEMRSFAKTCTPLGTPGRQPLQGLCSSPVIISLVARQSQHHSQPCVIIVRIHVYHHNNQRLVSISILIIVMSE